MRNKGLTSALIAASLLLSGTGGLSVFASSSQTFSYSDGKVTVEKTDGYDSAAIVVASYNADKTLKKFIPKREIP